MGRKRKLRATNRRQAVLLVVLLVLGSLAVVNYFNWRERSALLTVFFESDPGERLGPFYLEIASTPSERALGLMYRKSLAADRGMLFVHPREGDHSFWMKDTFVSLDMIFVDPQFQVVGIVENAPINSERRHSVGRPSLYVVELVAGSAARHGIGVGAKMIPKGPIPRGL